MTGWFAARWLFLTQISKNPWFGVVLSGSLVAAGFLAALLTDQIKATIPFEWHWFPVWYKPWPLNIGASLFWLSVAAATLLTLPREIAMERERNQQTDDLIRQSTGLKKFTGELFELVRTLPPKDFLANFASCYSKCERVSREALSIQDPAARLAATTAAIRDELLRTLAILAFRFDSAPPEARYAANVMTHLVIDEHTSPRTREFIKAHLRFAGIDSGLEPFEGVLVLDPELTAVAGDQAQRDSDLTQPIALPIPKTKEVNDRSCVIPGAPYSYVKKMFYLHEDTASLLKWCDREGYFHPSVRSELEEYFKSPNAQNIKSFVSIYLGPVGVLNLHRNIPKMLAASQQFYFVVSPFTVLLTRLLDAYVADRKTLENAGKSPQVLGGHK